MSISVKFEGGADLQKALAGLNSQMRTRKAAREALKEAAEPIRIMAEALAPRRSAGVKKFRLPGDPPGQASGVRRRGALKSHISMGTKLSRRQAGLNRANKMPVEVYVGTRDRVARLVEFGTEDTAAQPFMRRSWAAMGGATALRKVSAAMWESIANQMRLQERAALRRVKKKV